MAVAHKNQRKLPLADKARLLRVADEVNRQLGVVIDPNATAERAQAGMLAHGIRPEDCEFSREIIHLRNRRGEETPETE